jgi:rod shape-determining protein MreD
MKYLFLAGSSLLAITAQMIVGTHFFLFNFVDLSLILITYWAFYRSRTQALFVGSLTGILQDAVLGWPLGYNGFGKTLAAFVIAEASRRFDVEGGWVRFVLMAASSCLSSLSMFALFLLLQRSSSSIFLGASLLQALITAGVGVLLFAALDTYNRVHTKRVG